ncbi:hypothetical protein AZI86_11280 [Bdellovibrio bacteriovorus]|uniref:Uncharacterized protein n=1 Tax=Bdellovibrio bacteriovorus TaxID=959 RepID=A0A150WL98_BDEBC|nr:hypothetical protein [Bdellovibrio bacteriovorus]KYG64779.1 hypothetical protein AZI86_11280 [Bdellovibrio bacteriovorus]
MKLHFAKKHLIAAAILLTQVTAVSPAMAEAMRCESVFTKGAVSPVARLQAVDKISYKDLIELDAQGFAFAKGSLKTAGKEMQFGFESEYTLNEVGPLTNFYGPAPEAGISKQAWLAMPVEKRMEWVFAKAKSIPFGAKDPVMVLLDKNPELSFLPQQLIKDDTGNVEIVVAPANRFETWLNQVRWINKNLGVGSMQAMISQPKESFFAPSGDIKEVTLKEDIGYFNFVHEADVLSRMAQGAEKFAADNSKEVMRPFLHPYLGPMVKFRHKKMVEAMTEVAHGKILNPEETAAIIKLEHSFKYIGSSSWRPDIAGTTRVSQEVRDAHKDEALLVDRVARSIYYAQKGRSPFVGMDKIKVLDTQSDFEKFTPEVQNLLKTIYPSKAPKKFEFDKAILVHETFRNFAYPLKSWRPTLQALDASGLSKTVSAAQEAYVAKLTQIAADHAQGQITTEQARALTQGALSQFAVESRLNETFVNFQSVLPKRYSEGHTGLMAPRRGLELRLASFKNQWKDNVQVIPGVTFKYRDGEQKTNTDRDVLMISTDGLSAAQVSKLEKDYLDMITIQAMTFPLKERASHTLVQVDGKVYNFGYNPIQYFSKFRTGDYAAASSRRLEPIVLLSRLEEVNMTKYIANIKDNKNAVLGRFRLEGDPRTHGKIDNNKSECGNNCTTWVTGAPIGKNGESLVWLLGGDRTVPWVQQNPGWLGSWMVGTASLERVPMVAYWTPKSIQNSLKEDFTDNTLNWDFNRK